MMEGYALAEAFIQPAALFCRRRKRVERFLRESLVRDFLQLFRDLLGGLLGGILRVREDDGLLSASKRVESKVHGVVAERLGDGHALEENRWI